jgi:hypothetical protein
LVSVNSARQDDARNCSDDVLCGACEEVGELATTGQYFIPTCYGGTCGVFDLRGSSDTECESDDDCFLRDGSGCCEECGDSGFLALSSTDFLQDLCAEDTACVACDPSPPAGLDAACDQDTLKCALVNTLP